MSEQFSDGWAKNLDSVSIPYVGQVVEQNKTKEQAQQFVNNENNINFKNINIPKSNDTAYTVDSFHNKTNKISEQKMSIYKLDSFLKDKKINDEISGIKIDVDGEDLDIILGSMEIIKKFRPSIIIEHYTHKLFAIMNKINYQIFSFTSTIDKPYNIVLEKLEVYDSKKWIKMIVCVPSEYVPKLSYPIKIHGNILFGINRKLILKIFS